MYSPPPQGTRVDTDHHRTHRRDPNHHSAPSPPYTKCIGFLALPLPALLGAQKNTGARKYVICRLGGHAGKTTGIDCLPRFIVARND